MNGRDDGGDDELPGQLSTILYLAMFLRDDTIDQIFARIEEATPDDLVYWLLTDRQGSVRDVVDNSGVVKDTIVYNSFGNITSKTDSDYRGRYDCFSCG